MIEQVMDAGDFPNLTARPIIICLGCLGIVFLVISVRSFDVRAMIGYDVLAAVLFGSAWWAWRMEARHSFLIRWLLVAMGLVMEWAFTFLLNTSGLLPLLFVPVALAVLLIDLRAGLAVASLQTGLVVLGAISLNGQDPLILATSLIGAWLFLVFYVWYSQPVRDAAAWSWSYRQKANRELAEARNQRGAYEQSLKDLEQANIQMRALNRLAQNLRLAAEKAKMAKEQFVANVSHELRTPINMITGYTEMILNSPGAYGRKLPGALLADLAIIQRNAEHLSRLINDVLDLSQVEADRMALSKEYVNVGEVMEFSLAAVQPLFKLKHLSLTSDIEQNLPPLFCDRTRLQEVLLNLLSNAARFTEQGGVHLRASIDGANLLVEVRDTGPGIAEADLHRLFNPFEQLDASIRRKHGGTGLGLAISKRFIELHDGWIWVESQLGAGTTFKFTLPVTYTDSGQPGVARWFNPYAVFEAPDHLPKLPAEGRPRLVVVEQQPLLMNIIQRYMGDVDAVLAHSAEQAREIIGNSGAQAIVTNLPSSASSLQELDPYLGGDDGVPVIACAIPDSDDQAANRDLAGILVKPISQSRLMETLGRLKIANGTVLIVDDEPDALQLFARMLNSKGDRYRVLLARDGREALSVLEDCRPDVILLDLVMPNLDGFHLLEVLRHPQTGWHDIPVVLISAQDPSGHPTVSSGLMIRQAQGLSVRQLITCIRAVSRVLSPLGGSAE